MRFTFGPFSIPRGPTPEEIANDLYQQALSLGEPYATLAGEEQEFARELMLRFEEAEVRSVPLPNRDLLLPVLLAKNGRHAEAVGTAEQRYRQAPSWTTAVALAMASLRSGDKERAVEMFTQAAGHDPADLSSWLEIGDIRLEQERWAEALSAYANALERNPAHPWALPSAHFCRHQLNVPGPWMQELERISAQVGCTCGLEGCLSSVLGGTGPSTGIQRAQYLLTKLA